MGIRKAHPLDAAGIAAVVHSVSEIRTVANQTSEVTEGIVKNNLTRISEGDTSSAYVAENESGIIIGYGCVHWAPFLFLRGGEGYVTELFVRPSDTGKQWGSRLLAHIVSEAKSRGCARLSLLNGRDGASYQRRFYHKLGWMERDRMANFVFSIQ